MPEREDLDFSYESKVGEREVNEDTIGADVSGPWYCFLVCDGLGGHEKGEEASGIAVETALAVFRENAGGAEPFDPESCLSEAFEAAQEEILKAQKEDVRYRDMKTTMVMLLTDGKSLHAGHIGDSRLYVFRGGKVIWQTEDHSVPQMLVRMGEIKKDQIRFHEDRNRLLRALGIEWDKPQYEIAEPMDFGKNISVLLCTDGFWEWITEDRMEKLLKKARSAEEWLSAMEEEVARSGAGNNLDNYSSIAIYRAESIWSGIRRAFH